MLRVDGQQQPSAPLLRSERQVTRGDEALLVRERERDAAPERPERRPDAGEADDGVEDEVGLGPLEQLGQVAAHLHVLDAVLGGELREIRRPRRERTQLELRIPLHDLDGLPADRAGGPEEGDPLHPHSVPKRKAGSTGALTARP